MTGKVEVLQITITLFYRNVPILPKQCGAGPPHTTSKQTNKFSYQGLSVPRQKYMF